MLSLVVAREVSNPLSPVFRIYEVCLGVALHTPYHLPLCYLSEFETSTYMHGLVLFLAWAKEGRKKGARGGVSESSVVGHYALAPKHTIAVPCHAPIGAALPPIRMRACVRRELDPSTQGHGLRPSPVITHPRTGTPAPRRARMCAARVLSVTHTMLCALDVWECALIVQAVGRGGARCTGVRGQVFSVSNFFGKLLTPQSADVY